MLEPGLDMTKSQLDGPPAPEHPVAGGRSRDSSSPTALVWMRRDIRLADHPALRAALDAFANVVVAYVWDPALISRSGTARLAFLSGCLGSLDDELRRRSGGGIVQLYGRPSEVLAALAAQVGAEAVYATEDFGPYGSRRDANTRAALARNRVDLRFVSTPYAVAPGKLVTASGSPFQVFTPFWKAWRSHGWDLPIESPSNADLAKVTRFGISDDTRVPRTANFAPTYTTPGEHAARERLEAFLAANVADYRDRRDLPGEDGTSRLSAYLRFGCLHPRQILSRLDPISKGSEVFEKELCWREFYADVLWQRPDARDHPYRQEWSKLEVDEGPDANERFEAWAAGMTGYPIVDAGMRQLLIEGWMHNRVRMITASFLVKDLHIDWRRGARWFMDHLVDGDLASNQLGWQWVAGSGNDAAPFFRVFNPTLQGAKFDPSGRYVRRYVPELSGIDDRHIHTPHELAGSLLGVPAYPTPIVDHHLERDVALDRYNRMRS